MMKRLMTLVILLTVAAATWAAQPPTRIHYKGVLRNADDSPRDGSHDMIFRYFDGPTSPAALMEEYRNAAHGNPVTVTNGLFDVQLGTGYITENPYGSLSLLFRDHGQLWLEIQVGTEVLSPRVQMLATPFALNADRLDGRDSVFFLDAMDAHASAHPLLRSTSEYCVVDDSGSDCNVVDHFLVRVPPGSATVLEGMTSQSQESVEIRLRGEPYRTPDPGSPGIHCNPGVKVDAAVGSVGQDFCLSAVIPLYDADLPDGMRLHSSLHTGSWIALRTTGFDFSRQLVRETDLRIFQTSVTYPSDGVARLQVVLLNDGSLTATAIVQVTECEPRSCDPSRQRAQSRYMEPIPFRPEVFVFDVPRCSETVGGNSCQVSVVSPEGHVYATQQLDY